MGKDRYRLTPAVSRTQTSPESNSFLSLTALKRRSSRHFRNRSGDSTASGNREGLLPSVPEKGVTVPRTRNPDQATTRAIHRPSISTLSSLFLVDPLYHHNPDENHPRVSDVLPQSGAVMIVAPFGNNIRAVPAGRSAVIAEYGHPSNNPYMAPTTTISAGGASNPSVLYQHIQDVASKRISTLDYLRKAHTGKVHWFNTVLFTPTDLSRLPSLQSARAGRRATNYLLLGLSLPSITDLHASPLEYLRALNALLTEFESYQSIHPADGSSGPSSLSRARIPQMFKRTGTKGRRVSSAASEIGPPITSTSDDASADFFPLPTPTTSSTASFPAPSLDATLLPGEEYAHLLPPSLPFDPDFYETFATLCDVLIDTYTRILNLLGGPANCSPTVGEMFAKADARMRKVIVSGVVKDFEEGSRAGAKAEVGGVSRVVLGGLLGNGS